MSCASTLATRGGYSSSRISSIRRATSKLRSRLGRVLQCSAVPLAIRSGSQGAGAGISTAMHVQKESADSGRATPKQSGQWHAGSHVLAEMHSCTIRY
jgi:hypothetical protein